MFNALQFSSKRFQPFTASLLQRAADVGLPHLRAPAPLSRGWCGTPMPTANVSRSTYRNWSGPRAVIMRALVVSRVAPAADLWLRTRRTASFATIPCARTCVSEIGGLRWRRCVERCFSILVTFCALLATAAARSAVRNGSFRCFISFDPGRYPRTRGGTAARPGSHASGRSSECGRLFESRPRGGT